MPSAGVNMLPNSLSVHLDLVTSSTAQFADHNGYTLAGVFVDARGRADAFYALIERIHTDDVTIVAVPDPTHLEHLACLTGADLRAASRYLRARILLLPAATGR
jgi:hypothetical protein